MHGREELILLDHPVATRVGRVHLRLELRGPEQVHVLLPLFRRLGHRLLRVKIGEALDEALPELVEHAVFVEGPHVIELAHVQQSVAARVGRLEESLVLLVHALLHCLVLGVLCLLPHNDGELLLVQRAVPVPVELRELLLHLRRQQRGRPRVLRHDARRHGEERGQGREHVARGGAPLAVPLPGGRPRVDTLPAGRGREDRDGDTERPHGGPKAGRAPKADRQLRA
mmetsp:Transcript_129295/g.361866  ORF Transcript_129295/g.361866 Transcript_129295/m.361866 type:complete len:227 (-) Transcript_129295:21-701(-)